MVGTFKESKDIASQGHEILQAFVCCGNDLPPTLQTSVKTWALNEALFSLVFN